MELGPKEFESHLEAIRPRLGNYHWMWKILRWRARSSGWFPRRIHALLRRLGNPRRPYFIGTTPAGVSFVGDYRDEYTVGLVVAARHGRGLNWTLSDNKYTISLPVTSVHSDPVVSLIIDRLQGTCGAYLDVGTNVGVVATEVARFLQGRQEVIAFEPHPETVRRAAATFALNGVKNVRLFAVAIGDVDGEITFYCPVGFSDMASAKPVDLGLPLRWVETKVPCYRLDTLAERGQIPQTGFIKFDVEGHEPRAVEGALQLIRRDRPAILYEYSYAIAPRLGWTATEVAESILRAGEYRFHVLRKDGTFSPFPPPARGGGHVDIFCESMA
ncbi:MAG TPA: FkbM family methyltransferase [Chthonomonadales bacterium]|nr:FkbM family methyltransferase [Chthonomonadales bacterium]